jgi:type VI protein secretion system component VasA
MLVKNVNFNVNVLTEEINKVFTDVREGFRGDVVFAIIRKDNIKMKIVETVSATFMCTENNLPKKGILKSTSVVILDKRR